MGKPIGLLEIEIFDWPDSFFVEANSHDRDYFMFFPEADPFEDPPPHFVDLSVYDTGWCSCTDFRRNVEPFMFLGGQHRRECIHIIAARRYRAILGGKPKPMPRNLF